MADVDGEKERRRLEGVYSAMTDEELRELAEDGGSLTPMAVQVLTGEIARRGLQITVATLHSGDPSPDQDNLESRDLVTIRTFQTLTEATIAKGMLESAGIASFLLDENVARVYVSNVVGGIRLQVDRADAEAAIKLLEQSFEVPDAGSYQDDGDEVDHES